MTIYLPDAVWTEGGIREGVAVAVEGDRISWVGEPEGGASVVRLAGRLLLPGFVNAHSHAFQRAIRGRSEYRRAGSERDDFWAWREVMYRAALELEPDEVEAVSRMAFLEMALSGITTVGEFHYLHHPRGGGRYQNPEELALRVGAAAQSVGLNLVLLRVGYGRAGFGREANPRQIRFVDRGPDETLASVDRLRSAGMKVGLAPHSVRALPLEWIREMGRYAREHGLPFHMHVSEQPREIEECLAEHGRRPVELMVREGLVDPRFTGVHAIHLDEGEIRALGEAEANVCACPTTERNLGDGIVPARALSAQGVTLSFGTDSQIEIAPMQDARSLDYHLRLETLERAMIPPLTDTPEEEGPAARLLEMATVGGARSLCEESGRIAAGAPADLVAVDLDDPSIAGAGKTTLLANVVYSMERTAIRDVWVRGRRVVSDGRHPEQESILEDFRQAMERLWGRGS